MGVAQPASSDETTCRCVFASATRPVLLALIIIYMCCLKKEAEIASLHRPGALGGRDLHGKVGLQPAGEGIVGTATEIKTHRQAGLPCSGRGPGTGIFLGSSAPFFRSAIWRDFAAAPGMVFG